MIDAATRKICSLVGHMERAVMLPEDLFGPYVFSAVRRGL